MLRECSSIILRLPLLESQDLLSKAGILRILSRAVVPMSFRANADSMKSTSVEPRNEISRFPEDSGSLEIEDGVSVRHSSTMPVYRQASSE